MRRIFLACPYSHPGPAVVHDRFMASKRVAAAIIEAGHAVFSQVSMSHPINDVFDCKRVNVGDLWAPVDRVFMESMNELIVLDLPGWEASNGIVREMDFFHCRERSVSLWSEVSGQFTLDRSAARVDPLEGRAVPNVTVGGTFE